MPDVDLTADGIIHDRGRGPEIKGTRITVYVIMDHYGRPEWPPERIAAAYGLSEPQVRAALHYIATHEDELMPAYRRMVERAAQGNPPEVQAKIDAAHSKFLARLTPEQRHRVEEIFSDNGSAGGQ
jgi:uncharacterized protein (DUF433 family)